MLESVNEHTGTLNNHRMSSTMDNAKESNTNRGRLQERIKEQSVRINHRLSLITLTSGPASLFVEVATLSTKGLNFTKLEDESSMQLHTTILTIQTNAMENTNKTPRFSLPSKTKCFGFSL